MINNNPKISVIMGIYNCDLTLEESINSLLDQTYQDFEVIMCDDGSTDDTYIIAKMICDKYPEKFTLLRNHENMGLNYTLNKCLSTAKGEYIARMDGDDISLPTRFEKEVEFLDRHANISIISCAMIYFDEEREWGVSSPIKSPQDRDLVKGTPFAHAPCMIRKKALDSVGGYSVDKRLLRVEDYHLWVKMYSLGFKGYNLIEPLYKMRDDKNAVKRRNFKNRLNEVYVKYLAVKLLKLPFWNLLYVFRPILVGLLPIRLYTTLHKMKLNNTTEGKTT